MSKKKYAIAGIVLLIMLLLSYIQIFNDRSENISYPFKEIIKTSREEYETKAEIYLISPTMHHQNNKFIMPSEKKLTYFKAIIKDEGQKELGLIDIEVYFIIDENNKLLKKSSFAVYATQGKSKEKATGYLSPILLIEEYPPVNIEDKEQIIVLLSVYADQKVKNTIGDYKYSESSIFNYNTLEVIE